MGWDIRPLKPEPTSHVPLPDDVEEAPPPQLEEPLPPPPPPGGMPNPFVGMTEEEAEEALKDPHWRIRHLYYILDKDRNVVVFKPNEVQEKFLDDLWYRNVVPKARQRGFSTVFQLVILDTCLFVENTIAGIIAQDEDVAKSIRDNKIMFAYDRMPEFIRNGVPLVIKNVTELKWSNGSMLIVSNSTRGNTVSLLHVSEYGIMCQKAPEKADEVQSGSLPSVTPYGIVVVESTVESIDGNFSEMVLRAKEHADSGRPLSNLDYRMHFASWWDALEYELDPTYVVISTQDHAYFHKMEAIIGRDINLRKRAWYVTTRDVTFGGNKEKMFKQYPTTLEEAFSVSMEGIWLTDQLVVARRDKRITKVPYDPAYPVNTFWDLGLDDDIAIWFHQAIGPRNHWIDFFEIDNVPYSPVAKALREKPYVYGKHYLPHDGAKRVQTADSLKTAEDILNELGVKPTELVPRIPEELLGINQLREAFSTYYFDAEKCKEGIAHLDGFKKQWNRRLGRYIDEVLDNGHQHAADAIRQHAQYRHLVKEGLLAGPSGKRTKRSRKGAMAQ